MNNTLTTLRAALSALEMQQTGLQWYRGMMPEYVDGSDDEADAETSSAITDLRTLIASMEAQEPVLYQYRWLNPANNPDDAGLMDWKLLEPRNPHMGTVQAHIKELESYRYGVKPIYEVRSLYTPAQPSEPKAEPCRCEPLDYVRPAGYDGDGSVAALAKAAQPKAKPVQESSV